MYAEEVDWCWRIQRAGWPFYCVPSARVIHWGGASTQQFRSQSFLNLWRSRKRLYDRFYGPLRRTLASGIVRLGMAAEVRRSRRDADRGALTPQECEQRVSAARAIVELFSKG
jgi:GT2 family glycosyltransferase